MSDLYLHHQDFAVRAEPFVQADVLARADVVLVDAALRRFAGLAADELLAAALAVGVQRRGHVGVDLRELAQQRNVLQAAEELPEDAVAAPPWPEDLAAWERAVLASPIVSRDGNRQRPLVAQPLPGGRHLLMTQRLWDIQARLAQALRCMAAEEAAHAPPPEHLQARLLQSLLLGAQAQHVAAREQLARTLAVAAGRRLTLVLGGPGTGKTFSIRFLLAALLSDQPQLRVLLAAPTGKAAVRMTEAMREAQRSAPTEDTISELLANLQSSTIHKLLGKRPDGGVRYGPGNPLPADIVVVDEASMVDLVLMGQVVDAIAPGAQLLLLGDRDQLASVDVGTVLADIAQAAAQEDSPLHPCLVHLTVNYRFADAPLVSAVAAAVQTATAASLQDAVALLNGREATSPQLRDVLPIAPISVSTLAERTAAIEELTAPYCAADGYVTLLAQHLRQAGRAALTQPMVRRQLLDAIGNYRVLAVHRRGPLGVEGLEKAIGQRIRATLTAAWQQRQRGPGAAVQDRADDLPREAGLWLGQLVLVTENAYDVDLRNGDIGLVVCAEGGRLAVVFPVAAPPHLGHGEPSARWPGAREVAITRLPPHTGALAMTVHKSQGSQFRHVCMVLADGQSPLQSRELVYTALTRAQQRLSWAGSEKALRLALSRTVMRASGLGPLLAGPPPVSTAPGPGPRT